MNVKAARSTGFRLLALSAAVLIVIFVFASESFSSEPVVIKIRDLTSVEGMEENPLIGYGMVVGLAQTGDSQQTVFTTQTLANIMQRMGAQIPAGDAGGQECGRGFCDRQPAGVRAAGHVAGCNRLFGRRCQEPGRRPTPADSPLWRGRAGLRRRPGSDYGRGLCDCPARAQSSR